jgi:DNA-binding MarR family transcriptional regulator
MSGSRAKTEDVAEDGGGVDLSPLSGKLGFLLRLAQQRAFDAFHGAMGPLGLTPGRMGVLLLVEANPDIRQAALAEALRVKPSNLTVLLASLEAEGLIRRAEDAGNRRANRLRLTSAGRFLLKRAKAAEAEVEAKLAEGMPAEEQAALLSALRRMAGA